MLNSDIGLIKLPTPIEFTDIIKPVSLACTSNNDVDVIAIGNGIMDSKIKELAPILQYVHLKTVSLTTCVPYFPIIAFRKTVICSKGDGKRSICNGDSGGPLIEATSRNLIGVSSFGSALGCGTAPQGFTRVTEYLKWIEEVTSITCKK